MDFMVIFVSLILIGLALLLVLYPLWQQTQAEEALLELDSTHQSLEELQVRYEASLAAIKDLMFDHEMGKVATEDYEVLLSRAKLEAAQIRQQIDQLSVTMDQPSIEPNLDREVERLIKQTRRQSTSPRDLLGEVEAEIEALKTLRPGRPATASCSNCGRAIRPDDAFCSGCGQGVVSPQVETCPQCGYTYQAGDTFCARCGTLLGVEVPDYEDTRL